MATPNAWTRERVKLTKDHVRNARRMLASGAVPGRGMEWGDTDCVGLSLRVGRTSASWYLRMDTRTVRLADMEALTVAAAREAAKQARLDVRAGRNERPRLDLYAEALRETGDIETASDAAFCEDLGAAETPDDVRRTRGPWQWRDLVDIYLAKRLSSYKAGWAEQYERNLRLSAFDAIAKRELRHLTVDDLEEIRDEILDAHSPSLAARAMNQSRAMLTWGMRNHRRLTKLGTTPWWDALHVEYKAGTRAHEPTLAELGRTLAVAERYRVLGSTRQETSPGTLKALWAVVLTAQRTGALTGTRYDRMIEMPGRPDWQVWTWSAVDMKGGKAPLPHALPVPPEALEVLARFDDGPPGQWVFPSRAAGKHVTSDGLNQLMYRLQGKEKAGRDGAITTRGQDLFARHRIRVWVPHDVRRTIGSLLAEEELGGAASAILAHKTGGKDTEEAKLEDVTRKVYARAQRLDLKAKGMEVWVRAVLDAYRREAAALDRTQR